MNVFNKELLTDVQQNVVKPVPAAPLFYDATNQYGPKPDVEIGLREDHDAVPEGLSQVQPLVYRPKLL